MLKPTGSEPTWVIGSKLGNALSFDGTDDYVDCNNNVGNFYLLDPFSIASLESSAPSTYIFTDAHPILKRYDAIQQ